MASREWLVDVLVLPLLLLLLLPFLALSWSSYRIWLDFCSFTRALTLLTLRFDLLSRDTQIGAA